MTEHYKQHNFKNMKNIIFLISVLFSFTSFAQQRVEMKRDSGVTHVTPYVFKDSVRILRAKIKADSIALRAAMGGGGSQNLQQVTDLDSVTTNKVTVANLNISGSPFYVSQDSAVAHGLVNGDVYRNAYVNGAWQTAVVAPFPDHWELLVHYTSPGANSVSLTAGNINNIAVYWGDGTNFDYVLTGEYVSLSHTYIDSGLYTIKILGSLTGAAGSYISASGLGSSLISTSPINGITGYTGFSEIGLFQGCNNLTSIPAGMFDNCPLVTDFGYAFYGTSLTSLPIGLFDHNPLVTSFYSTFSSCNSLTSLPNDLFRHNTLVTTFANTFQYDTALHSLPNDLFRYNTAVNNFSGTFVGCLITTLPAGLIGSAGSCNISMLNWIAVDTLNQETFKYFTGATTEFSVLFSGNTVLTTIPDSLFYWNADVTNFGSTFYGCTALTAIPLTLFDNNTLVTDFTNCFSGDTALLGNAPPLWVTYSGATGTGCFTGTTGLTNYAAIDVGWK
jgi:hypothetical protein